MNTTPSAQNGQTSVWGMMSPYVVPPASAAVSIIPVYECFVRKSAKQLSNPVVPTTVSQAIKKGATVAPTVAAMIGTQMVAVKGLSTIFQKDGEPSVLATMGSSMAVAGLSVPLLAAFNGMTNGMSWRESIKKLTRHQAMSLMGRELSFLAGVSLSGPGSEAMKRYLGDSKAMEYVSAMMIAFAGSIAGHPADTVFTRLQNDQAVGLKTPQIMTRGVKVQDVAKVALQDVKSLYQGGLTRGIGVCLFSVFYKTVSEMLS